MAIRRAAPGGDLQRGREAAAISVVRGIPESIGWIITGERKKRYVNACEPVTRLRGSHSLHRLVSNMSKARRISPCLAIAGWLLTSPVAGSDVYKCAGEGGVPVYQEAPCGPAKELRNFQTDPPEI